VFRLCLHPLLVQGRQDSDAALAQYSLDPDLERRLIPRVLELVRSPEGHMICLGNWSITQLDHLTSALFATVSSAAIDAVLTTFSRQLVSRVDRIWGMRKQAKYLEAAAGLPSSDPGLLRYFQRKFEPYQPRPSVEPKLFYGVRLGNVPGVYTSGRKHSSRLLVSRTLSRDLRYARRRNPLYSHW